MTNPQTETVSHMSSISREYARRATAYEQIALDAATAEAEYRRVHATVKLRAIHEGASAAKADAMADADPDVAGQCLAFKSCAAVVDAAGKKLAQLRAQLDYGRTKLASERAADQIHAAGFDGAA